MADALSLLKKVNTKTVDFNGGEVEVRELTFNQVKEFSELAKEIEDVESFENNRQSLGSIIRKGVVGLADVTDEDLGESSIASLKQLAEAVLEFNGLKVADEEAEGND
ncbi:MAG: hypothetical protein DRQ35_06925 [Gammaproteobacteria bacterium]|nr:MAG: hypothetical protein DRQ35_06925 [Gammaproteobacteria bacterium]